MHCNLEVNMSTDTSTSTSELLRDAQNFSLVLGGPLFQLLRRAYLSDDALLRSST
jgi:hypothetical protein